MGNIDSLRTYPEQICRPCLKHLTRTNCIYCSKDFHGLQSDTKAICWKCSAAQKEHGEPTPCHFCQQRAAFGQKICRHCTKDSEKYGLPIECNQCKKKCAFKKPHDLKEKVGNQDLCYLCTRQYKLMQHRNKKIQNGADKKAKNIRQLLIFHPQITIFQKNEAWIACIAMTDCCNLQINGKRFPIRTIVKIQCVSIANKAKKHWKNIKNQWKVN